MYYLAMNFNKNHNKLTGKNGEDIAANFLKKKGFKILKRNFSLKIGEIDILAEDQGVLVIVEVKTVKGENFGLAEELVRWKKQEKLKNLALALSQVVPDKNIRIDVVGINILGEKMDIHYIKNAVE